MFQSKCNVIVGSLYKPPRLITDIFSKEKICLYIGDFNIDTKIESQTVSTLTEEFISLFSSYSYEKLITLPTRELESSSPLINNIYTLISQNQLLLAKVEY